MFVPFAEVAAAFPWFFPGFAFVIGACVGSFLNVVIYRVPKGESVVTPGSHCGCGQPIKWHDNIPILSWLALRGRARCCGRPFSFRYPFVELLTGLLFVACWFRFSPADAFSPELVLCGWIFIGCLVAATFIDLDHFIIPDVFTIGLALVGLVLSAAVPALHGHIAGTAMENALQGALTSLQGILVGSGLVLWTALIAEAILRKEAMGFGDVKFVGAIGAFCGWKGAVIAMFGGACVGTVWITLAWIWQKTAGKHSLISPPVENPPAPAPAEAPIEHHEHLSFATLAAGLAGVAASFVLPSLHGQQTEFFLVDSLRAGTAATIGLLVGSAVILWIALLLPFLFRQESLAFSAIRFAGAVGAFAHWRLGWLGVVKGAAVAAAATAIFWSASKAYAALRKTPPEPTPADPPTETTEVAPAQLGFGVHVPFGPMLAIAGALYFLCFREWIDAWFAQVGELF
jgi:leader peptidase (prepilin peptidase)/N-methyltransferase